MERGRPALARSRTARAGAARVMPPMPWSKFDDGEPLGWSTAWCFWMSWLLPYRTAEYHGFDKASGESNLGPWRWNRPDVLRRDRG